MRPGSRRLAAIAWVVALLATAGCDGDGPSNGGSGQEDRKAAPPGPPARPAENGSVSALVPPTRPVTGPGSRPASRPTSPDVPENSRDPVVDGMKALVRQMILTGFDLQQQAALPDRIVRIFEVAGLGEPERQRLEAELLTRNLLEIQQDYRPKGNAPPRTSLTGEEEQRVRVAAEALARDLYRKLQAVAAPGGHLSGQHAAALRAAPTVTVPAGHEAVTWKTLGGFEYTEGMALPEEVRKLDKQKVGIAGYMMTIEEVENIKEFLLVEAFWSCCFGTPPTVNQVLLVRVVAEKGVEYTSSPVLVLGTLEVGEEIEDGFVTSVYRLKATSVTATE